MTRRNILKGVLERKRPFRGPKSRWNNIGVHLTSTGIGHYSESKISAYTRLRI
jgi:hypothetical protein